jgi:hypothetical protein
MNPEIKQKWIDALGVYPQSQNALKNPDGFCCLGVLCDIYAQEHNVSWNKDNGETCQTLYGSSDYLPVAVVNWAGLEDYNPTVNYFDEDETAYQVELSVLNDDGITFSEIAKLIEEQL